jgi:hypothetical protein
MISTDLRQIFHKEHCGFLFISVRSPGFAAGETPPPMEWSLEWYAPGQEADYWSSVDVARYLADPACPLDLDQVEVVPAPSCACCGTDMCRLPGSPPIRCVRLNADPAKREYRCPKHLDRNPCAIEGCKRTTSANGYHSADVWICGEHWRRYIPARSLRRRAYHAFFRRAKRHGWSEELKADFWRFFDALVASARRRSSGGHIDVAEIERLFG